MQPGIAAPRPPPPPTGFQDGHSSPGSRSGAAFTAARHSRGGRGRRRGGSGSSGGYQPGFPRPGLYSPPLLAAQQQLPPPHFLISPDQYSNNLSQRYGHTPPPPPPPPPRHQQSPMNSPPALPHYSGYPVQSAPFPEPMSPTSPAEVSSLGGHVPQLLSMLQQQLAARQAPPPSPPPPPPPPAGDENSDSAGSRLKFYKTRLCPFHFKKNSKSKCRGGDSCTYAHSFAELRPSVDLTKTKLCIEFMNGHCLRPIEQCPFAHGLADIRPIGANALPPTSVDSGQYKGAAEQLVRPVPPPPPAPQKEDPRSGKGVAPSSGSSSGTTTTTTGLPAGGGLQPSSQMAGSSECSWNNNKRTDIFSSTASSAAPTPAAAAGTDEFVPAKTFQSSLYPVAVHAAPPHAASLLLPSVDPHAYVPRSWADPDDFELFTPDTQQQPSAEDFSPSSSNMRSLHEDTIIPRPSAGKSATAQRSALTVPSAQLFAARSDSSELAAAAAKSSAPQGSGASTVIYLELLLSQVLNGWQGQTAGDENKNKPALKNVASAAVTAAEKNALTVPFVAELLQNAKLLPENIDQATLHAIATLVFGVITTATGKSLEVAVSPSDEVDGSPGGSAGRPATQA